MASAHKLVPIGLRSYSIEKYVRKEDSGERRMRPSLVQRIIKWEVETDVDLLYFNRI